MVDNIVEGFWYKKNRMIIANDVQKCPLSFFKQRVALFIKFYAAKLEKSDLTIFELGTLNEKLAKFVTTSSGRYESGLCAQPQ